MLGQGALDGPAISRLDQVPGTPRLATDPFVPPLSVATDYPPEKPRQPSIMATPLQRRKIRALSETIGLPARIPIVLPPAEPGRVGTERPTVPPMRPLSDGRRRH
jgi:hypothetical protein